jgi:glycosyltransferase involved in cell wall biosynthesis
MNEITVLIPAYNEAPRIGAVISRTQQYTPDIVVIDDGSTDNTGQQARTLGATVLYQPHTGYVQALRTGFNKAQGSIIITMDADGEHDPSYIPSLIAPLREGRADLVLGTRSQIPSVSERIIGSLVRLHIDIQDHGTGFRALTRELAQSMHVIGTCTCGTFVLEAVHKGARIEEVPISTREIEKPRKKKWIHLIQIWYVMWYMLSVWISG